MSGLRNKKNFSQRNRMEEAVLTDKNQFPTEEIILSHLGRSGKLWKSVFEYIHLEYPQLTEHWRYYNDGKSWLMKVTSRTKTIFWLSVIKNSFRITFYFTDKAEADIFSSSVSDELKDQFKNGKRFNKIRGLTITFRNNKDVEYAKTLIAIKSAIK